MSHLFCRRCLAALFLLLTLAPARAEEKGWTDLSSGLEKWKGPTSGWQVVGAVEVNPNNPRRLLGRSGKGVLFNGPGGSAHDLVSKQTFRDLEVHAEFFIPRGSNSGIKLMGLYEVQILDSHGRKKLTGDDCGGIYPRAEQSPSYHHIDEGTAPRVNAARPAGEWQTLDILFRAPRFDAHGKKVANARFVKVHLNGTLVHQDAEVKTPTGHAWHNKEIPVGPLLLQGDHGPVAFRNVRVRPLADTKDTP